MVKFNLKYLLLSTVIFLIEVLIATVFKDIVFVRSYLGDVIVVMLIYTLVLTFFKVENRTKLITGIFIFSVIVEVLQYFKIADVFGLKPGSIAAIVVGNSFSWIDILCYAAGCLFLYIIIKIGNLTK
ncbi:ribosomal maturation YjgA family protein [Kaistella jeonii]|uniref:DUF2809 domain-containing protein n=1 Tax=Kaistella jeonii TaxID=266749 RepID=A0A0C1FA14_9FLAO|nr:DUF2809 domain-containing protein [Kaistella jeonii]KIA89987.1 hypothetical protein OA86_05140 [Kaistella jeonii]SFB79740.1 Protein of unknown function [Kaistella jeonii]VEI96247.1 Protein of uncharacterised function (DUF2809) [Kaistella jeonii]